MDTLRIEAVENGFIVSEGDKNGMGMLGKLWAFESAMALSEFMLEWGHGQTKVTTTVTHPDS